LEDRKNYGATMGIFPNLHKYSWMLIGALTFVFRQIDYTLVFTQKCIDEHQAEVQEKGTSTVPDSILPRYLAAHNQNPEYFTHNDVLIGALTGIVAGADTTEITLGSVFHYLQEHPKCMEKLRAEVDVATSDPVTYNEAKQMPYLNAVIKEAQRMHSPVGTPLWRTVPKPGFTLAGRFLPEGTTVGVNAWVSQHSSVFAPDPDTFRPERWLDADAKTLAKMNRAQIAFGIGPRNCQGELIAMMQMSKTIPQLLRAFDFDISGKWETHNNWFVGYKGLTGKLTVR
jgi:cytochrome P450